MPETVANQDQGNLRKLDRAVIAPRGTRRRRAAAFQTWVLVSAGLFVARAAAGA